MDERLFGEALDCLVASGLFVCLLMKSRLRNYCGALPMILLFISLQLRVRDLEGSLQLEKTARSEAFANVEKLSDHIRYDRINCAVLCTLF